MTTVKIDKTKLLEILKTNRDAHHAVFLEAMEGYRIGQEILGDGGGIGGVGGQEPLRRRRR